jgi:hypothetical protein
VFATIKASVALVHPYKERLNPWALVRLLPNMQRVIVGQFRNRSDADGHLEILRRLIPYSLLPTPHALFSRQASWPRKPPPRMKISLPDALVPSP